MFVTSAAYTGAIALADADALCSSAAAGHALPGRYVAWLADAATTAYDRVEDVAPWLTTRGEVAFASKQEILRGQETALLDESGTPVQLAADAWQATDTDVHGPLVCFEQ